MEHSRIGHVKEQAHLSDLMISVVIKTYGKALWYLERTELEQSFMDWTIYQP